jgi:hypothetical protein
MSETSLLSANSVSADVLGQWDEELGAGGKSQLITALRAPFTPGLLGLKGQSMPREALPVP